MLLFNKVPLDKDPGWGHKCTGAVGELGSPALAHTWGSEGGAGWAQPGGQKDLPCVSIWTGKS